eukprot:scaffold166568_cov19-Prasinocladus_malaysianus.AAC.1
MSSQAYVWHEDTYSSIENGYKILLSFVLSMFHRQPSTNIDMRQYWRFACITANMPEESKLSLPKMDICCQGKYATTTETHPFVCNVTNSNSQFIAVESMLLAKMAMVR